MYIFFLQSWLIIRLWGENAYSRSEVTLAQRVYRKPRLHHSKLCCWIGSEEACCLVKVLDLLIFSSSPSCGPPQSSCFMVFYIYHCRGPSDGNPSGYDFILQNVFKKIYPDRILKWSMWGKDQWRRGWYTVGWRQVGATGEGVDRE